MSLMEQFESFMQQVVDIPLEPLEDPKIDQEIFDEFYNDHDINFKQKRIEELREEMYNNCTNRSAFDSAMSEYFEIIEDVKDIYSQAVDLGIDDKLEKYLERF
jgi:hypothetical protein